MTEASTLSSQVESTVEQLLQLPEEQRLEISDRLRESVVPVVDDATLAVWRRRLREIEDGTVEGIPAEDVFAEIRQALHEARQVSS